MQLVFNANTILPFASFCGAVVLALKVWKFRKNGVAASFLALMLSLSWWSLCALLEYSVLGLNAKILWINMSYFGITAMPVAWLIFTLGYTGREKWMTRNRLILLSIVPISTILIVWTNNFTHLMWKDIWLNISVSHPVDAVTHNIWFWVHATYSYSLILVGTLILFSSFRQASGIYRKQLSVMLLGTLVPWIANIIYLGPFKLSVDPTPFAFTITGIAFFGGLSAFHLMDIMPVAHDVVFKSMADGVIVLDNQQRVVEINNVALSIIDCSRDAAIGHSYNSILAGQPKPDEEESESREIAVTPPGQNQEKRFYEIRTSPIITRRRLNGYLVMLHDMTRQKEAEAESTRRARLETELIERKRGEEALKISEAKFRNLVENAPLGIVTTLPEGKILSANKAALEIFGFNNEAELENLTAWMLYANPSDRIDLQRQMREKGVVRNFETLRKRKDGSLFWVSQNTIMQTTESNDKQFVSTLIDNTERKKAAEDLARLNEDLKSLNTQLEAKVAERTEQLEQAVVAANASNKAKSDFLASMSHELRTPLSAILGFSQLLQEQFYGTLNEKQAGYVDDILTSGRHLLELINDILDLAKIEAGRIELQISDVHIQELVASSLLMVKEKALKHGIVIDVKVNTNMQTREYSMDERRIKQVMYNLLSNAVKFTPDGGRISIEARDGDDDLVLSVTDNGIGIPREHQDKLFTEFYQVQSGLISKTPGTGLGLAISKRIVETHGGKIWVKSEGVNKGSSFYFSLPIKKGERCEEPACYR
jgi:PAS domain S-box-containing protein